MGSQLIEHSALKKISQFLFSLLLGIVASTCLTVLLMLYADGTFNRWHLMPALHSRAEQILGVDFDSSQPGWIPVIYIADVDGEVHVCCLGREEGWKPSDRSLVTNWEYNQESEDRFFERQFRAAVDKASLLRKGEWDGTEIHFVIDSEGKVWRWRNDTVDTILFVFLCLWPICVTIFGCLFYWWIRHRAERVNSLAAVALV